MSSLVNRLASLNTDGPDGVTDAIIAADLARGQAARTHRRRRRSLIAGVASVGLVALSSAAYLAASDHGSDTVRAQPSDTIAAPFPTVTAAGPTLSTAGADTAKATTISLVTYRGNQLPGYSVKRIPDGYVLQGISASVLDIAKRGDQTPLDTFSGKLVVMLNDHPGTDAGRPVSVNGHAGRISSSDGVMTLTYSDGKHNVAMQSWSNIRITPEQLVIFAEGVTVLDSAQVGHG